MNSGAGLGFGFLRQLVNAVGRGGGARQALNALKQLMPAGQMASPAINQATRRAAVNLGLADELTAFPSVVSARGGNLGLSGTRNVPTAAQLGQAPVPQWGGSNIPAGARPVNQLRPQPYQGPRTRGGDIVPTSTPTTGAAPTRTSFTEDLINARPPQGPARPPVQGPSMTGTRPEQRVQGELNLRFPAGARSTAQFTTRKGATRDVGTNIAGQPYRPGPDATARNIETARINAIADALEREALEGASSAFPRAPQGQGSFFLDNAPDIWTNAFQMRPDLVRQLPAEVQRRIGTTMMREVADLGPQAPKAAFGSGAVPAPVDTVVDMAFKRGAAAGNELVDLGAMLNDPKIRALFGLGVAGTVGAGIAGMMGDRNRTGETTAGAPPTGPAPELFYESDGSVLGGAPGSLLGANPPAPGNVDPSAPTPQITSGNLQKDSADREARAQFAPAAAAVMRAVEPMSPEKYRSIEEYAAARQAYAQAKPEIQGLMRFMEGQSPTAGGGLAMWAASHPSLAFQYQAQQQALKNPAANQQSPESITTTTVTSPIGSEVSAAAVGNAEATSDAAVAPSAGAYDMVDVTRPQIQPNLQRVQEFIRQQAPRSAMYAGY